MPELPDVERFKRYLDATSLHKQVAGVELRDRDILEGVSARKLRSHLEGRPFQATSRHGKFLFVHPDSPPLLVLHFGMTGYLDYARQDHPPPEHARAVFHFDDGYRLAYVCQRKLGLVGLVENAGVLIEQHGMGPDAMDDRLTWPRFRELFSGRRGTIKSALMNQAILSGIGNVYADEILYQARIAPGRSVEGLDAPTRKRIYQTMRRVLSTSIRNHAEVSRLPRSYLLPHRETDGRCPRCGRRLEKKKVSGRGTYYCPRCQQ